MTLVVGLICKDGVVIGTDSEATFSFGSLPTIVQVAPKIDIVKDKVLVASAGAVGLGPVDKLIDGGIAV